MVHWTFRQLAAAVRNEAFTSALKRMSDSLTNLPPAEQEMALASLVHLHTPAPTSDILGPAPRLSLSHSPPDTATFAIRGSDMPLLKIHLCPGTGTEADRSMIMAGLDTGANIGVISKQAWTTHETSLRRHSPLLKTTRLASDQTMQGFAGDHSTILMALQNVTFRVGFCKVTTDLVVMEKTPHPVVLGMAFWWVYDLNLEGRKRRLSMLVPKGDFILQHAPPDLLLQRPELADRPLEFMTRQFMTSDYKPKDLFRLPLRTFQLRVPPGAAAP